MPRKVRVDSSLEEEPQSSDATNSEGEDEITVVAFPSLIRSYIDYSQEGLKTIQAAFQSFRKENKTLRKEKSALETEIQVIRASANAASSSRTGATPTARIKNLEKELKAAKNEAKKYKSRYQKLQAAELKREKRELEAGFEYGSGTLEDKYLEAKKLLRSFRALIEEIVLEDPGDEQKYPDCAICYDELSKDTAAAFPCEHIFHMTCIRELDRHAKERQEETLRSLACPTCRQVWDISQVVRVTRTAGEQWQDLIDVATAWAKLDVTKDDGDYDMDTSDKTSEPSFIENDLESAQEEEEEEEGGASGDYGEAEDERRLELDAPRTPPGSALRKRRLDELVASRSAKKQKR